MTSRKLREVAQRSYSRSRAFGLGHEASRGSVLAEARVAGQEARDVELGKIARALGSERLEVVS